MSNSIWRKRIPNLLVFLLLIASVGITSVFMNNTTISLTRASFSNIPQDVQITNVTDTSFTVSYQTSDKVVGVLSYGTDTNVEQTAQDDKDIASKTISDYTNHHISVKNLKPQTKYYFSITSGADKFLNNNLPYETVTAPAIDDLNSLSLLSGSVLLPDGNKAREGIVYLKNDSSQTLSTIINTDGNYSFDLSLLRSNDLNSFIDLSSNPILSIHVVSNSQQSDVKFSPSEKNSVPPLTLSQNYDFTTGNNPISELADTTGFPQAFENVSNNNPQILTPKKNEELIDQQPLFKGTASPGTNIEITINSETPIQEKATADANGVWTFRPSKPLSPGEHTITVSAKDQSGIIRKITQSFTVYASGTQVNQSATPSATITSVVPSNTPTPFPTLTPAPTLSPTPAISSPTPSIIMTKGSIVPTVTSPPGDSSAISIGVLGAAITISGILLFILTKILL